MRCSRAKRQAGNATELEVIQAEAALRQAEEDLKAALALRPARVKALEAALGIAVDEPRLAPLPEPQALGTELEALREGLEERLPALVQARQNLALAELEVRLADNDYTPRLTLEKARANLESARRALANALAQAEANSGARATASSSSAIACGRFLRARYISRALRYAS